MQRISWVEKKNNQEIKGIIDEKCSLMDSVRSRDDGNKARHRRGTLRYNNWRCDRDGEKTVKEEN